MKPVRFETSAGVVLKISRIPREVIDEYVRGNPAPEPPTVEVPVFGGGTERVDDTEDPEYQQALLAYNLRMAHEEFEIIAQAVQTETDWRQDPRVAELRALGFRIITLTDYLCYVALADEQDLIRVTEIVLYLSTVTQRGIREAEKAFDIHYHGVPLDQYPNPTGNLRVSAYYQAREAARAMGYKWEEFSELSGPEQSAVVAHYLCEQKVRWLVAEEERKLARARSKAKR